jgi:broad specificity phosphatase PhoE
MPRNYRTKRRTKQRTTLRTNRKINKRKQSKRKQNRRYKLHGGAEPFILDEPGFIDVDSVDQDVTNGIRDFFNLLRTNNLSIIFGRHMFSCANAGQQYSKTKNKRLQRHFDPLPTINGYDASIEAAPRLRNQKVNYIFASVLFRAYYTALLESQQIIQKDPDIPFNIIPYINENKAIWTNPDNKVDPSLWNRSSLRNTAVLKTRIIRRVRIIHKLINNMKNTRTPLNIPTNFTVDPLKKIDYASINVEPDLKAAVDYLNRYFSIRYFSNLTDAETEKCALIISHSGFIRDNLLHKIEGVDHNTKPLNNSLWKFSHVEEEGGVAKIMVEQIYAGSNWRDYRERERDLRFCNSHNNKKGRRNLTDTILSATRSLSKSLSKSPSKRSKSKSKSKSKPKSKPKSKSS